MRDGELIVQDDEELEKEVQKEAMRLRVLSGLQRGAEMALHAGHYLIGGGEDCDIVLTDDLVADAHLLIDVSDDALKIEARGGAVAVGETLLQPGEEMLAETPFAISLGQSGFGVGAPETDWSQLSLPDLAAVMAAAEKADTEESGPDENQIEQGVKDVEGVTDDDATGADDLASAMQAQEETEPPVDNDIDENADAENAETADADESVDAVEDDIEPAASFLARLKKQKQAVALAASLTIVLMGTTAIITHKPGDEGARSLSAAAAETVQADNHDNIRVLLNDAGVTEVDLRFDQEGVYRLSGYVADKEARMLMHSALQDAKVSFHDRVRQVDDIMRAIEFSLENYQWPNAAFSSHLIPTYIGGGVFAIDGYLGPEVDRTDLNRQIMADAPGVSRLDFKRARLADWQAELEDELKLAGLKPWIRTDLVEGAIKVSGEITPKEAAVWRRVGQAFVDKSRGWPKLKIAVRAAGPHRLGTAASAAPVLTAATPVAPASQVTRPDDFSIIGVIMPSNGPGRVLLGNGTSRAEGEALYDGAIVQSISLNKVTIRKGEKGLEFRVGEQG